MRFTLKLAIFLTCTVPNVSHAKVTEFAEGIQARVEKFVGKGESYRSLLALDQDVGFKGKAKSQPWSGDYWPLIQGSVAFPYAIKTTNNKNFTRNYRNYSDRLNRLMKNINHLDAATLDELSPTEKYDLYLGDEHFTLTQNVWQAIFDHYENTKENHKRLQEWEGICHGWATAAAYVKRPTKMITVLSLDGRYSLNFYPDDLKALATLLWANSKIQNDTILEGNLCQSKHPEIDEHSGKVTETTCKGINPGVWHLGVLGLLGKKHSSFIINKNNDTEVWNQPVSEYEFSYYNMNSDKKGSLFESAVPILNARDPSAAFRAHGTAYLVGVEMQLSYASETMPDHATTDSEQTDRIEQLNLRYDLELDDRYQVLGGEWHYRAESDPKANRNHSTYPSYPSFMWKFKSENPVAMSEADALIPENTTLPSDKMIEFSSKAASFKFVTYAHDSKGAVMKNPDGKDTVASEELRPQVLGKVLYPLIELAAQSE